MKSAITRRDFMRGTVATTLGAASVLSPLRAQAKKSTVVLIRNEHALDENFALDEKTIAKMLDEAVQTLLKTDTVQAAYQKLFQPTDIVGIKTNVWNYLPTPAELERSLVKRIQEAGVKKENLSINDREVRDDPVFQKSTALVNVRPLRTHYLAGMSGCMKNYITFGENWPDYHPNNCAHLAKLFELPMVKGKTRLNVLSVLTPQFHGRGPHHFNRRYVWAYKGLIVSADPVAADAIGYQILLAKRKEHFGKDYELSPIPRYIDIAANQYKLGTSDLKKIELIRLGDKQGMLI